METQVVSVAEHNAEIVRKGYEAFNKGDMKTLTELFHKDASWHSPGKNPIAGDRVGREATFTQFGHYGGDTNGTFKAELKYIATTDEGHVISSHRNTATKGGKKLDVDACIVFTLKDGKIFDGREYFQDLYAWDSFWS